LTAAGTRWHKLAVVAGRLDLPLRPGILAKRRTDTMMRRLLPAVATALLLAIGLPQTAKCG
jgi:hypothetical protein